MVASGDGGGGDGKLSLNGTEFEFSKMKMFQRRMVVIVAQPGESPWCY